MGCDPIVDGQSGGGGGAATLAATLDEGNETDGADIIITLGDAIRATGISAPIPLTPGPGGNVQANGPLQVTGDVFPSVNGTLGIGSLTNRFAIARCNAHQLGVAPSAAVINAGANGRILADATAALVTINLPDAVIGLEYQVLVVNATNGVDLSPSGLDQVNGGGAGTALTLSVVGRYFVTCIDSTNWLCHGPVAVT